MSVILLLITQITLYNLHISYQHYQEIQINIFIKRNEATKMDNHYTIVAVSLFPLTAVL